MTVQVDRSGGFSCGPGGRQFAPVAVGINRPGGTSLLSTGALSMGWRALTTLMDAESRRGRCSFTSDARRRESSCRVIETRQLDLLIGDLYQKRFKLFHLPADKNLN
jgi:hypothetical protein